MSCCLCLKLMLVIASKCPCIELNKPNPNLQDPRPRRPRQLRRLCSQMSCNSCKWTQTITRYLKLSRNLMCLIILFVLIFLSCISQPDFLRRNDKHSHVLKSKYWSTGLTIEQTQANLSVNGISNTRSWRSQGTSPNEWIMKFLVKNGGIWLGKPSGLDLKCAQCFVATNLLLMIISSSWRSCWKGRGFHGVMSIIWMKGSVSEVVEGGYSQSNSSYPIHDGHIVSFEAEILSSLQSLNVCVLMAQHSLQDSYLLGKSFTRTGLRTFLKGSDESWYLGSYLQQLTFILSQSISMSGKGWTDDFLCEKWFQDIFIPCTKAWNTSDTPILLVYNGHGSHLMDEMFKLADENNIELFQLPHHTTHWTQPLDIGVFGPLQWHWMERCNDMLEETGEEIWKEDFIREYMAARELAFLSETIKIAQKRCGICLLNPNVFTD